MLAQVSFEILSRKERHERVALHLDGTLWNVVTGPTAVAIIQEVDSKTRFDEREMKIIKAMFAGEVSAARLFEGDITYSIWIDMTQEEMNRFLEKIG